MTDPIGDFLIRIKNASRVGKETVSVPFSNIKSAIAELLSNKGYVGAVTNKTKGKSKILSIELVYKNDRPAVTDVERISKPSRRLYKKAKEITRYRRGYGLAVFSTPRGILADTDAKKENVGGEHLFNIW